MEPSIEISDEDMAALTKLKEEGDLRREARDEKLTKILQGFPDSYREVIDNLESYLEAVDEGWDTNLAALWKEIPENLRKEEDFLRAFDKVFGPDFIPPVVNLAVICRVAYEEEVLRQIAAEKLRQKRALEIAAEYDLTLDGAEQWLLQASNLRWQLSMAGSFDGMPPTEEGEFIEEIVERATVRKEIEEIEDSRLKSFIKKEVYGYE